MDYPTALYVVIYFFKQETFVWISPFELKRLNVNSTKMKKRPKIESPKRSNLFKFSVE